MIKSSFNSEVNLYNSKTKIFDKIPQDRYQFPPHIKNHKYINQRIAYLQDQSTSEFTHISQLKASQQQNVPLTRQFLQDTSLQSSKFVDLLGDSIHEANFTTPCKIGLINSKLNFVQEFMKASKDTAGYIKTEKSLLQSQEYDKSVTFDSNCSDISYDQFKTIQENFQEEESFKSSFEKQNKCDLNTNDKANIQDYEAKLNMINKSSYSNQRTHEIPNGPLAQDDQFQFTPKQKPIKKQLPQQDNHLSIDEKNIYQVDSNISDKSIKIWSSNKQQIMNVTSPKAPQDDQEYKEMLIRFLKNVHFLTGGIFLKKYGRYDHYIPSKRLIQLSPDLKHLVIRNQSYEITKIYPIDDIIRIQMGRKTENFKRFKNKYELNIRSCSLMMKERTLDLESADVQEIKLLVTSLSQVLSIINKQFKDEEQLQEI